MKLDESFGFEEFFDQLSASISLSDISKSNITLGFGFISKI